MQSDNELITVTADNLTVTLLSPAVAGEGHVISIKLNSTGPVTVLGAIDGALGVQFSTNGSLLSLQASSSAWVVKSAPTMKHVITAAGVAATNRAYNRLTTVTVSAGSATLVGVQAGDTVGIDATSLAGAVASKVIGTAIPVIITGLAINGANASSYVFVQPVDVTVNITAVALTVTGITASNKTYDGLLTATLSTGSAALSGVISSDTVTLSVASAVGAFATAAVANGKTVQVSGLTISGADAGNYTLTQPTTTANVTVKTLTVTGIYADKVYADKVYDGTTTATFNTLDAALVGVTTGDVVTLSVGSIAGSFGSAAAGFNKTITVSGLAIGGAQAGNYSLTQPTVVAAIRHAPLTVSGVVGIDKILGAGTPGISALDVSAAALVGVVGGDTVTLGTTGAYGKILTPVIGNNRPVQVMGMSVTGSSAANYILTQPVVTINIASP
jgi:hypothetical protein